MYYNREFFIDRFTNKFVAKFDTADADRDNSVERPTGILRRARTDAHVTGRPQQSAAVDPRSVVWSSTMPANRNSVQGMKLLNYKIQSQLMHFDYIVINYWYFDI